MHKHRTGDKNKYHLLKTSFLSIRSGPRFIIGYWKYKDLEGFLLYCVTFSFILKTILLPQSMLSFHTYDSHIHNAKMHPGGVCWYSLFQTLYTLMSNKDMVWKVVTSDAHADYSREPLISVFNSKPLSILPTKHPLFFS